MTTKVRIVLISLFIFLIIAAAAANTAYADTPSQEECERLHDEIEDDFRKANYCETDADCKVIQLGGWYIDFGCYKYVNVATDEDELMDKVHRYKDELKCSAKINDCMPSGTPVCINRKCSAERSL